MPVLRSLHRDHLSQTLALTLSALVFLALAHVFPIAVMDLYGKESQANLWQTVGELFEKQSWFIGVVVLITAVLMPVIEVLMLLYVTWPLYRSNGQSIHLTLLQKTVIRMLPWVRPWSMIEILLLGVLVSIVKLHSFAHIMPSIALWSLLLALLCVTAAFYTLKKTLHFGLVQLYSRGQTRQTHYANFRQCWAFVLSAAAFYLPANILPVMETRSVYAYSDDTIYSGVVFLWETGSWHLAIIIFFASIVIPLFKIVVLALLLLCVQFNWLRWRAEQMYLYRVIEVIGRWSMLDIFVATMMGTLVQLQGLGRIEVGSGAAAFAAVVIFTMLASQSFDPRWLLIKKNNQGSTDS